MKIRNFRLYFFGQAISVSGTFMQAIAQAWLVLTLTGSGVALGLVLALQSLPVLVLSPWGGVIADRFRKRRLLYLTQTASGLLALILGLLVLTGAAQLWMVYLLALGLGLVNAVDNPTRQAFVSEMVGKEELRNAVTLNSSQVNLARVIGPAIAGVLIATTGLALCFLLNAASYLAVLAGLALMRDDEFHAAPPVPARKGQLREGFRYAWANPVLRNVLIMVAIIGTLTYEFQVSLPLLAEFTFKGSAESYALLTAALGLGSVVGGLLTATSRRRSVRLLAALAVAFGVTVLAAAVAPTLILEVAAIAAVGFVSIIFLSMGNTLLQLESSAEMRGRVMSFWTIAFLGSTAIGGPLIGWISQVAGPRWGLVVGGVAAVVAAGVGYALMRQSQRRESARKSF